MDAGTATVPRDARHRIERSKARARYDRESVHAILDAGMIAHVAFCVGGQPFVIPMLYARDDESIVLHGSIASRLMGELADGVPACLGVTHLDGLVLARSHFDHSVNYRSVVVFGRARAVVDEAEKAVALSRFVDAMIPGRAAESRAADRSELAATQVLRLAIEDASAKVRSGGAKDNPADLALPHWAGVVPMRTRYAAPQPEADLADPALPASVRTLLATNEAGA
ncbi:MAG TPA: pyridoxamine 5'-phosphate oxidase family protein [Dokdonella sp.]|nr:pyridoxamine 5'-phosphate oxidase family protein [Dokdonella sp.]